MTRTYGLYCWYGYLSTFALPSREPSQTEFTILQTAIDISSKKNYYKGFDLKTWNCQSFARRTGILYYRKYIRIKINLGLPKEVLSGPIA